MSQGHDRLWRWFGLGRASWLTMPRVMMHAMPDDWQNRMAALLEEWGETWDTDGLPGTKVSAVNLRTNRFIKWPNWVLNYRHPDRAMLQNITKRKV